MVSGSSYKPRTSFYHINIFLYHSHSVPKKIATEILNNCVLTGINSRSIFQIKNLHNGERTCRVKFFQEKENRFAALLFSRPEYLSIKVRSCA